MSKFSSILSRFVSDTGVVPMLQVGLEGASECVCDSVRVALHMEVQL